MCVKRHNVAGRFGKFTVAVGGVAVGTAVYNKVRSLGLPISTLKPTFQFSQNSGRFR